MYFLNPLILIPMLIMAALAAATLVWLLILAIGLWKKKRWAKWIGGVGAGISILSMVLVGGCTSWMWSPTKNPDRVFQSAFGKLPPLGVTNAIGVAGGFGDSGSITVQFYTDDATFRDLLPQNAMPISLEEWMAHGRPELPEGCHPLKGDGVEYFSLEHDGFHSGKPGPRGFGSERVHIAHDPKSGQVQYFWSGID